MALRWTEYDGFNEWGVRVAMVARHTDQIPGEGLAWTKPYWVAFMLHQYVLANDEPGRWATKGEAMTAAETAYVEYLRSGGEPPLEPEIPGPQPRGVRGHIRSLVRAWRLARRSTPAP